MSTAKPKFEARSATSDAAGAAVWTVADAAELYRVEGWSDGFFLVNEAGHVAVRPFYGSDLTIDVTDVIAELRQRGVRFPALLRFQDVLRARVV